MLSLTLNGRPQELDLATPADLLLVLKHLEMKPDRIAVELNGVIVARINWSEAQIESGDKIEVVHFVGGGTANFKREMR